MATASGLYSAPFYVRYRYDEQQHKRYTTVEIIVQEGDWMPPPARLAAATVVGLRVGFNEVELQRRVKLAGGKWNPRRRLWEV